MSRSEAAFRGLMALRALSLHGGHEAAARSLGLTRSALSHRLLELERTLGAALVQRKGRGSALTEEGQALLAATHRALGEISEALTSFERPRGGLRLSTVHTFASNWLVPRLTQFQQRHPTIDLSVTTTQEVVDLDFGGSDCAIRHGMGQWPGAKARLLFRETLAPVAAADHVAPAPLHWRTIRARTRPADWGRWWSAAGQRGNAPASGLVVQNRAQALEASLAGAGVALTDVRYAAPHVAAGRLRFLGPLAELPEGYYFVKRASAADSPQLYAFEAWLLQEAAKPVAPAPQRVHGHGPHGAENHCSAQGQKGGASDWRLA